MTQGARGRAEPGPDAALARGNPHETIGAIPSAREAVGTLAAVTLKRLRRGKALWIGIVIATLPVIYATSIHAGRLRATPGKVFDLMQLLLAVVPAMLVGASLGDELEDRTSAYLWSRPLARWTVLAGKLCALVPVVTVLIVGGWYAAAVAGLQTAPSAASYLALIAACVTSSLVAAGMTTMVPKHGMALTIGYLLVDLFIGAIPFSVRTVSITHQTRAMAGLADTAQAYAEPAVAMVVIAGIWAAIGFLRIRRLEV